MFYDARTTGDNLRLDADICIVGAGAAGISLAMELAGTSLKVVMLESGGFELEPGVQALYEGESTGAPYLDLDASRLRYFGGTTNHWTGWTRPLDAIDFRKRDWVADSGWPIDLEDLKPWYSRAQQYLDLGEHSYEPDYWRWYMDDFQFARAGAVETVIARHSPPTRFGDRYRKALHKADNIHVILHANVVDFDLVGSGESVASVTAKTLEGRQLTVNAGRYVLATGGIENARILLGCNRQQKQGLANSSGLVGRYFADHFGNLLGIVATTGPALTPVNYRTLPVPPKGGNAATMITAGIKLTESRLKEKRLPNFAGLLLPYFPDAPQPWGSGEAPANHRLFDYYVSIEPQPLYDSRVYLDDEVDALGFPRVALHRARDPDHEKVVDRIAREFAAALGEAGLGRMKLDLGERHHRSLRPGMPGFGSHHMGTTRMSASAKDGVVNADCRTHDLANLYVAGSSVFPTFGYAQPTFTIVALAIRLADHLKAQAGAGVSP